MLSAASHPYVTLVEEVFLIPRNLSVLYLQGNNRLEILFIMKFHWATVFIPVKIGYLKKGEVLFRY